MSDLEEAFALWVRTEGLPEPVREHKFDPGRGWRLDFAWPEAMVAVEIEGLVGGAGGRHQRLEGFEADCLKYEAAMMAGWTVYRLPGSWVMKGRRMIWRPRVITVLRRLLKLDVPNVPAQCKECGSIFDLSEFSSSVIARVVSSKRWTCGGCGADIRW